MAGRRRLSVVRPKEIEIHETNRPFRSRTSHSRRRARAHTHWKKGGFSKLHSGVQSECDRIEVVFFLSHSLVYMLLSACNVGLCGWVWKDGNTIIARRTNPRTHYEFIKRYVYGYPFSLHGIGAWPSETKCPVIGYKAMMWRDRERERKRVEELARRSPCRRRRCRR